MDRFLVRALTLAAGYRSRYTDTHLGRLHHLEVRGAGHRPTAVLLHGFSAIGAHYGRLIQALRPAFARLVAPDLPGHGLSAALPADLAPADLDAALVASLDAATREPVVLFGNSLGGYAAIRYALARPERVRALVLASPGGAAMPRGDLQRMLARFHLRSHAEALRFVDDLLVARPLARHLLALGIRQRFARPDARAILPLLAHAEMLTPDDLARLAMPTLVLWGERDAILPAANAAFFRRHLPPHARFEVPAGLGHSPYLERPDAVARRIVAFVDAALAPPTRPAHLHVSS